MSWKTEITVTNNRTEDVICIIPKGQIFENKRVEGLIQNVAAAREYRLIIPGSSKLVVEVEVLCINEFFSPPKGQLGNVSIYKIASDFRSQQDLWNILKS